MAKQNEVITTVLDPRVEQELHAQLRKRIFDLKLKVSAKEKDAQKATAKREEAGVILYNTQDRLAKLQEHMNSLDVQYTQAKEEREAQEARLENVRQKVTEKAAEVKEMETVAVSSQEELDHLNSCMRSLRQKKDDMEKEIALAKRTDSKMKQNSNELEKEKSKQDWYIIDLQEKVSQLERKRELIQTEIESQKQQAAQVSEYLNEINNEVASVSKEKKKLIQQWNSSLAALRQRDEALAAARKQLHKLEESLKDDEVEEKALQKEIQLLEDEKQALMNTQIKLDTESRRIDQQIDEALHQQEQDANKYTAIKDSTEKAKKEEEKYSKEFKRIVRDIKIAERKAELLQNERQAIEQKIYDCKFNQQSLDFESGAIQDSERILHRNIRECEIESAKVENTLARLQVKKLNMEANICTLKEHIVKQEEEVRQNDQVLIAYENTIRQIHSQIEYKTNQIDVINKKYQSLVESYGGEEPLGPLEGTIKALKQNIELLENDMKALQDEWLQIQVSSLEAIENCQEIEEKNTEETFKLQVLSNKKLRLQNEVCSMEAEVKSIAQGIRTKHRDIGLLNEFIDKHNKEYDQLTQKINTKEREHRVELERLQTENQALEAKFISLKNQIKVAVKETGDVEQQILTIQDQIVLTKKNKQEITTSDSARDVKGMEQEIRNMQQKLSKAKRQHETLVQEIRNAIKRFEEIRQKKDVNSSESVISQLPALDSTEKTVSQEQQPESTKVSNTPAQRSSVKVGSVKVGAAKANAKVKETKYESSCSKKERQPNSGLSLQGSSIKVAKLEKSESAKRASK